MKAFTLLGLSALASTTSAMDRATLRRRLSFEKIAGYSPGSEVTDHCAIDRDQKAIEDLLARRTNESFDQARLIYQQGGNSKSYAEVTLEPALQSSLAKGTMIMGKNEAENEVAGKAYADYDAGIAKIRIQYQTSTVQSDYVNCQVGALVSDVNTEGCFAQSGTFDIGGQIHTYIYDPLKDNNNARTISGFSTGAQAKMLDGCKGCPYTDFKYFYDYYGSDTYADDWVLAALSGDKTNFQRGNADFSQYGFVGRQECAKKGSAYMNIFMYVIREFEDALDDCERGCINCNDDPVHAWDEGVCFYTGSIEGQDGLTDDGKLLHQLADKRCENFKTCGVGGDELDGFAKVNYDLFDLFAVGKHQLQSGNCPGARETTKKVTRKMYIPLIQGTLRYAYKVDALQGDEKEKAEGAVFAASILPRIHAASASAAETIYSNMRVGASGTSFKAVKAAFESVYDDLGISCAEIGGLWNEGGDGYYAGMEPCGGGAPVGIKETNTVVKEDKSLAITLGTVFGALFAVTLFGIIYLRSKEKSRSSKGQSESYDFEDGTNVKAVMN